jgi:adenylate cyclase
MERYFTLARNVLERHGGTVEKFIGDAVMAVFGVPVLHEDDALRALRAAVEMRDALPELALQGRIGVTTGEVVTGTEERLATGDAVNVAARLEQAAQPGEVLIGQTTLALVRDTTDVEPIEPLELKGKQERVAIFEPIGLAITVDKSRQNELALWNQALKQYRAQEWDMAELQLINLQGRFPATELYSVFLKRITHFRSNPPSAGWDGTWAFETK